MSAVTFDSWESVIVWARRHYDPNLPLYYSEQHVRTLLDMIGAALNRRQFRYVYTHLPLIEPIVSGEEDVVFISRYLVALYVNQPVRSPVDRVTTVQNVDLIGELAPVLRAIGDGREAAVASDAEEASRVLPLCEQSLQFTQKFSEAENVRFHHLIRLTLLVAHWQQHRAHMIPYNDHSRFRDLRLLAASCALSLLLPGTAENEIAVQQQQDKFADIIEYDDDEDDDDGDVDDIAGENSRDSRVRNY